MLSFREMVEQMQIDDATMARHVDALLRDFVADHLALFGFWDEMPAEAALSKAGWISSAAATCACGTTIHCRGWWHEQGLWMGSAENPRSHRDASAVCRDMG
jgi:hypothetical protein